MNKKKKCPECGKIYRTKCFKYNPLLKKKICWICDRRKGHNPFYEPQIKGSRKRYKKPISYNITEDEGSALYSKKIQAGENAKEGVKFVKRFIYNFYKKKRQEKREKLREDKELQKKFVEGLK